MRSIAGAATQSALLSGDQINVSRGLTLANARHAELICELIEALCARIFWRATAQSLRGARLGIRRQIINRLTHTLRQAFK
jgi:hypothetical protein